MDLQSLSVRHAISLINPAIVESWCLKCGLFIAASDDVRKLQAAEDSHPCISSEKRSSHDSHSGDGASPHSD